MTFYFLSSIKGAISENHYSWNYLGSVISYFSIKNLKRLSPSSLWWALLLLKSLDNSLFITFKFINFCSKQFLNTSIVTYLIAILFSPSLDKKIYKKSSEMYFAKLSILYLVNFSKIFNVVSDILKCLSVIVYLSSNNISFIEPWLNF